MVLSPFLTIPIFLSLFPPILWSIVLSVGVQHLESGGRAGKFGSQIEFYFFPQQTEYRKKDSNLQLAFSFIRLLVSFIQIDIVNSQDECSLSL